MISILSIVEWDTQSGDVRRGTVVAINGPWATIQHGWRADIFDVPIEILRLWKREETAP